MSVPRPARSVSPISNSPLPSLTQFQPWVSPALRLTTVTWSATMKAA